MDELSRDDILQLYNSAVVMFKGEPVFVYNVNEDSVLSFIRLKDGIKERAPFSLKDFTSTAGRLGMVNILDTVVWTQRQPVRRYSVGIARDNFSVLDVKGVEFPAGRNDTIERIKGRNCIELYDCLKGNYPSLQEAFKLIKKGSAAVAFDKQFAVCRRGRVYYKFREVGTISLNAKSIEEIRWNRDCNYIDLLLEGKYEKGVGTHRIA